MTNETQKFIRICETLAEYTPGKPLTEVFERARELMASTKSEGSGGRKRPSRAKAKAAPAAEA